VPAGSLVAGSGHEPPPEASVIAQTAADPALMVTVPLGVPCGDVTVTASRSACSSP